MGLRVVNPGQPKPEVCIDMAHDTQSPTASAHLNYGTQLSVTPDTINEC